MTTTAGWRERLRLVLQLYRDRHSLVQRQLKETEQRAQIAHDAVHTLWAGKRGMTLWACLV